MDKRPAPVVCGEALAHKAHNACAVAGAATDRFSGSIGDPEHGRSALLIPLGSGNEDRERA
jgi:hypothetical protein